jgi:glutamate 5-kinase
MTTKVRAAELAARSGTNTTIVGGRIENVLQRLFAGEDLGTLLYAQQEPLEARKLWLAGITPRSAKLVLDAGAVQAVRRGGVSVLPVGVLALEGDFTKGDMVLCVDEAGKSVAKGLINYNADDCLKIKGASRERVTALLGYQGPAELIHCDNSVLL